MKKKRKCREKAIKNNRKPAALPLLITGLVLLLPASILFGLAMHKINQAEIAKFGKR